MSESIETKKAEALESVRNLHRLVSALPRSRESSLALTKLDETRHWIGDIPVTAEKTS